MVEVGSKIDKPHSTGAERKIQIKGVNMGWEGEKLVEYINLLERNFVSGRG